MEYIVTAAIVLGMLWFGPLWLFLMAFGSMINHIGKAEQDDEET